MLCGCVWWCVVWHHELSRTQLKMEVVGSACVLCAVCVVCCALRVLCAVCLLCFVGIVCCMLLFPVPPEIFSELIPAARKIEFESWK